MKRTLHSLILLAVLTGFVTVAAPRAQAQEPTPLPDPGDVVTFSRLGVTQPIVLGPFDSVSLDFGLPAEWELLEGAALQLTAALLLDASAHSEGDSPPPGCPLDVALNDMPLGRVLLQEGAEQTISIPLSASTLAASQPDGRHQLHMAMSGTLGCGFSRQTGLVIRPTSHLVLPHRIVTPPTDLGLLPWPIYQGALVPDTAVIVVPDQPAASDLQAALSVAAGFGGMTGGRLALTLTTAGQLSPEVRASTHLIVVGNAAALAMLREVALPLPLGDPTFTAPGAGPDDGIVQLAVSPWNSTKVVLVVTGSTEAAVITAGQAISAGIIPTGHQPNLAIVAEVRSRPMPMSVAVDRTFADLGYAVETVRRVGVNELEYRFSVPPGQTAGIDASIGLRFNHTAILDQDRSVIAVSLNDIPIGSARLSGQSAALGDARFAIPRSVLRPGENRLVVQATLVPRQEALNPQAERLWLTVWPESLLHLPLSADRRPDAQVLNLRAYPDRFVRNPTLGDLAFVVAPNDPAAWNVAAQIALRLGEMADAGVVQLAVFYGDAGLDRLRDYDLLLIGRPSTLPLIGQLGNALPAPFEPGNDLTAVSNSPVVFRMAPGTSVGYLQMLAAPWDRQRALLAVLGSTEEGIRWAGEALTTPSRRSHLKGNFAVVSGERIISDAGGEAPQEGPPAGRAEPARLLAVGPRPQWILLALGISLLLIVAIIATVTLSALRRRAARGSYEF